MDRPAPALLVWGMDDVRVHLTDDAAEVERLASGWLAEHAVDANVLVTNLAGQLSQDRRRHDRSWAIARTGAGRVVGVLAHTAPYAARVPVVESEVAELAARAWHEAGRDLPGVTAPLAPGRAFVGCWEALTGLRGHLLLREGLHVLDRLQPARGVPGHARQAGPDDADLVLDWLEEFRGEVMHHSPALDPEAIRAQVADGVYVLWEVSGGPVSLAGRRAAAGVGRVGPVYTPPEHRGRGYAAAVTTTATQDVLDTGARATLFTDLDNPTSNGVYARLGYRLVDELGEWRFEPRD